MAPQLTFEYTVGAPAQAATGGSLNIGVDVVRPTAMFAPYPVYASMTSDGGFPRLSKSSFDLSDLEPDPPADKAMAHSMCYWDTGNTGLFRNEKVPDPALRNRNRMDGPFMAHVYGAPGTYTIKGHKYDPDGAFGASADITFTVIDPTDHFPIGRHYVVAPDGDFTGSPHDGVPGVRQFTSINAARDSMSSTVNKSTGLRLCLKKGFTYEGLDSEIRQDWAEVDCLIDTWGDGSDPIIDGLLLERPFIVSSANAATASWRVNGVVFQHNWDARHSMNRKPTPRITDAVVSFTANGNLTGRMMNTFHNVTFTQCRNAVTNLVAQDAAPKPDDQKLMLFFQDCLFEAMGNYMVFGHATWQGTFMMGCELRPDDLSCMGNMGRDGMPEYYSHNSHNAIRGGWGILGLWSCGFEERHAWSGNLDGTTKVSVQQVLRHSGKRRLRQIISGCYMGTSQSSFSTFEAGSVADCLVDKCLFLHNPNSQAGSNQIGIQAKPGLTVRNCLFIRGATPSVTPGLFPSRNFARWENNAAFNTDGVGKGFAAMVGDASPDPVFDPAHAEIDLQVVNCMLVDLKSGSNGAEDNPEWVRMKDNWFSPRIHNSPIYAPNLSTPVNAGFDLDTTPLAFQSRMGGLRWSWEIAFREDATPTPDGTVLLMDYPDDWFSQPTTAADYAGAYVIPRHTLQFWGLNFVAYRDKTADFTFGATASFLGGNGGGTIVSITDGGDGTGTLVIEGAFGNNVGDGDGVVDTGGGAATVQDSGRPMRLTGYVGGSKPNAVVEGMLSVTFGPTHIEVTNTSGFDWPGGERRLKLDRGTTLMPVDESTRVPDGTLAPYRFTTPLPLAPGEATSLEDMGRNLRPGTNHPDAPAGTDSQGPWVI